MFDNSSDYTSGEGSKNAINTSSKISTGWNPQDGLKGLSKLREMVGNANTMEEKDLNIETLNYWKNLQGRLDRTEMYYSEVSKAKNDAARSGIKLAGAMFNHATQAMANESQFASTVSRGIQRLERMNLKLNGIHAHYEGFTHEEVTAERLIDY